MRNKFIYSCSVKIHVLEFNKPLNSIVCVLLVVEAFFLQKVVKMLVAQFIQLLKLWLCDVRSDIIMEKNWALSVDQCWLQA